MEVEGKKEGKDQNGATHDKKASGDCLLFHCISKLTIIIFHISGHIMRSSVFEHVSHDTLFIHISSLTFNYLIS